LPQIKQGGKRRGEGGGELCEEVSKSEECQASDKIEILTIGEKGEESGKEGLHQIYLLFERGKEEKKRKEGKGNVAS